MDLVKAYLVEIGQPEKFEELRAVAKKHRGVYHQSLRNICGPSFLFTILTNALAFMEETKGWPQYKERSN